jgi:hypothetical protein
MVGERWHSIENRNGITYWVPYKLQVVISEDVQNTYTINSILYEPKT